jgi:hypothetical protein
MAKVQVSSETYKKIQSLAKHYGISVNDAADKAANTGCSRLTTLHKFSSKTTKRKSTKKAKKAKKTSAKKGARKAKAKKGSVKKKTRASSSNGKGKSNGSNGSVTTAQLLKLKSDGKTNPQIAAATGLSKDQVFRRLRQARA